MSGLLFGIIGRALAWLCLLSPVVFLLSLAGAVRLLPALLTSLRWGLRGLLILSFRLYRLILNPLAAVVGEALGLDVLAGWGRILATLTLSLGIGLVIVRLLDAPVTAWTVALCGLHGLVVGLTWDEIESPGDLQLGVRR